MIAEPRSAANEASRGPNGFLRLMRTVCLSTAWTRSTATNQPLYGAAVAGSEIRSHHATTSSAVSSEPSCHVTPLRRLKTYVTGSGVFQDSARAGRTFSLSSYWVRLSTMCSTPCTDE